ncbi:MAG TPA: hypothetical protein VKJ65_10345, partial [Phycisphaerae bacterium]|nr:hypothetical protein [Phycisphaerae bacterium]
MVVMVLFAAMWHNQPPRSGRKDTSEKPDPAVLFSRKSSEFPKTALSVTVQPITESLRLNKQISSTDACLDRKPTP